MFPIPSCIPHIKSFGRILLFLRNIVVRIPPFRIQMKHRNEWIFKFFNWTVEFDICAPANIAGLFRTQAFFCSEIAINWFICDVSVEHFNLIICLLLVHIFGSHECSGSRVCGENIEFKIDIIERTMSLYLISFEVWLCIAWCDPNKNHPPVRWKCKKYSPRSYFYSFQFIWKKNLLGGFIFKIATTPFFVFWRTKSANK